jgi:hypothetical protein
MSSRKNARKNRSSRKCSSENATHVREAINWFIQKGSLRNLSFHGNTSWCASELITLALLWTWSASPKLTEAFDDACIQSRKLFGKAALTTYQGLAGALKRWTPTFMSLLQTRIHELIEEIGGRHMRVGKWCAIAIDGSRLTTPRTVSNEKAFCAKNYGKGKTAKYRKKKTKGMRRKKNEKAKAQPQGPQIWVTMMWHVGLGLPWCWKLGPSNASERRHVMDMIETGHFLKNTLFIGDAGFVGYEFWRWILSHRHDFMVRVGANVKLLRDLGYHVEKRKGKKGIVYCWPNSAMGKKLPPLILRLVEVKLGCKKVSLLTSVLDEESLSRSELLRLYKLRWGIELEFRGLKQTFERRKLRSHNSERALVELEWSLLGMAVIELFALRQQLPQRKSDPRKLSLAESLKAIRQSLKHLSDKPDDMKDFKSLLKAAVIDDYTRKKPKRSRYNPNKKDTPSCGKPKVTLANMKHRQRLKKLNEIGFQQAA